MAAVMCRRAKASFMQEKRRKAEAAVLQNKATASSFASGEMVAAFRPQRGGLRPPRIPKQGFSANAGQPHSWSTIARVSRAITNSSLVGITNARTEESGVVISIS